MDSALNKINLYDFFTVFLSGMITVLIGIYLEVPIPIVDTNLDNDFFRSFIFLLGSYVVGILFQEVSSFIDEKSKFLQFRKKASENFLNENNSVVKNKLELKDYQKIANDILKKNKKTINIVLTNASMFISIVKHI